MELRCQPQCYGWGKRGFGSLVARLLKSSDPSFEVSDAVPYAELWIGTHRNGESILSQTGCTLHSYLFENKELMGSAASILDGELPFLLKVLSIEKALSIQAHPNKELAHNLFTMYPDVYKDSNHKPELAIALTPFKGLIGFRPSSEIVNFLTTIPELESLIPEDTIKKYIQTESKEDLKDLFQAIMTAPRDLVKTKLDNLIKRLTDSMYMIQQDNLFPLLKCLSDQFPNDVGCFAIYLLNMIDLTPGQSVYLHPGLPHAYLSGDIIECMAASDNVVRAGLTPKMRDVDVLCSMLDYESYTPASLLFNSKRVNVNLTLYKLPVQDFAVSRICVAENTCYTAPVLNSCSALIVIEGKGTIKCMDYRMGSVFFFPTAEVFEVRATVDTLIFQAYANPSAN